MTKELCQCAVCMGVYDYDLMRDSKKLIRCPKCGKGFLRWMPLYFDPKIVEQEKKELEADRAKNEYRDKCMLRNNDRIRTPTYHERITEGFKMIDGIEE